MWHIRPFGLFVVLISGSEPSQLPSRYLAACFASPFSSSSSSSSSPSPPPTFGASSGTNPPFKKARGGDITNVLYRTGVVSKEDFCLIQKKARLLVLSSNPLLCDETSSVAVGRQGAMLHYRSDKDVSSSPSIIVRTLDRYVRILLRKHTGHDEYRMCPDLPAELRVYQRRGASMAWHQDDVLYDPPQIEVVYTVENSSDCVTQWKDQDGRELAVETDPNSALVLAAGGAWHCVTRLKFGRRVIVKMAYILPSARRVDPPRTGSPSTTSRTRSVARRKGKQSSSQSKAFNRRR